MFKTNTFQKYQSNKKLFLLAPRNRIALKMKSHIISAKGGVLLVLLSLMVLAQTRETRSHSKKFEHERHLFDLTHPYDERMPIKDDSTPLEVSKVQQDDGNGARSEYFDFCTSEKLGTHINAPRTYRQVNDSHPVDRIPLKLLINIPGIVVDLPASEDEDDKSAMLTRKNLEAWEDDYGKIPHGAFVILRTGWSVFFKHQDEFFGNFAGEDKQMFPGFSEDAVSWLLDARGIAGLGTECADIELPWKTKQAVKQLLAAANKYSVVQLAHVDLLPERGFDVTIAPLKMKGGSGGPTRVFASLHNDHNNNHHQNGHQRHHTIIEEPPISAFHTETSQKVRRVEPREEPTNGPTIADSQVDTTSSSPVVVFTAEEYQNNSPRLSSSFTSLSTIAIFSFVLIRVFQL